MAVPAPDLRGIGYEQGQYLGRGGEGAVFRYTYRGSQQRGCVTPGQPVAIKFTPAGKIRPNEILVQARIDHSGVVKVLDVSRYSDPAMGACLLTILELANPMPVLPPGASLGSCIDSIVNANMCDCVFAGRPGAVPVIPLWAATRPPSLFPQLGGAAPATAAEAEPDLRWIIAQVAVALDFLHQHPMRVCHRDVKAANVLVTAFSTHADGELRPEVKLADFGFSKALRDGDGQAPDLGPGAIEEALVRSRLGTACYMAPEIYGLSRNAAYCGMKADVWSLGIMMCVLVTGLQPFLLRSSDNGKHVMQRSRDARHVRHVLDSVRRAGASAALTALLQRMLTVEPESRCTMHEVLHSQWMSLLDGDIRNPHAGPPGHSAPDVPQFLPMWDALKSSQRERAEEARAAYRAHATAHAPPHGPHARPPPRLDCSRCGWTLPHLQHATVVSLLEDMRAQGRAHGR